MQNQHTRELISTQKMLLKTNNKDTRIMLTIYKIHPNHTRKAVCLYLCGAEKSWLMTYPVLLIPTTALYIMSLTVTLTVGPKMQNSWSWFCSFQMESLKREKLLLLFPSSEQSLWYFFGSIPLFSTLLLWHHIRCLNHHHFRINMQGS